MNTTKAVRIHALGGPEVLRREEVPLSEPGPGEVLVRHEAIGLNFIDTYHRSGLYPVPSLPTAIGMEAAGVVEAVGPAGGGEPADRAAPSFQPGDRVAYGFGLGAYCERRVMPTGAAGPDPRRRGLRDGRGGDAEGDDVVVPLPPHLSAECGRDRARACGCGRGGHDPQPVVQGAGCHRDRHRGERGEGRRGPRARIATT